MATSLLKIVINDPNTTSTTSTRDFFAKSRHVYLQNLVDRCRAFVSGTAHGSGAVFTQAELASQTQATGTVTCASASAADTVTVGNIVFTAVSGTPSGNQFKVGVSNTADGLSLATAINANTSLNPYVSAGNASGVVTISSVNLGALGNLLQLSSSNNTRLAVVGMASGVDATITTYNF